MGRYLLNVASTDKCQGWPFEENAEKSKYFQNILHFRKL